jgi:hypothetical protein
MEIPTHHNGSNPVVPAIFRGRDFHWVFNISPNDQAAALDLNSGDMWRATELAAKSVPQTKNISGPKSQAEGAPRKCNPGTDDSNPALTLGKPFT